MAARQKPTIAQRATVLLLTTAAYLSWRWPSPLWREWLRARFGHPAYRGPWMVVEHALLYTTICAAACALVWAVLSARVAIEPVREALRVRSWRETLGWGVAVGLAGTALVLAALWLGERAGALPSGVLGWRGFDGWSAIGNLFSNFYEEFIYRGLWFAALAFVCQRRAVAWVGSSLIFAASHGQYPHFIQALIFASSLLLCLARERTGAIWAPYVAHQLSDLIADLFV
jgi:membrane protease YdiL (CAAX protease family)